MEFISYYMTKKYRITPCKTEDNIRWNCFYFAYRCRRLMVRIHSSTTGLAGRDYTTVPRTECLRDWPLQCGAVLLWQPAVWRACQSKLHWTLEAGLLDAEKILWLREILVLKGRNFESYMKTVKFCYKAQFSSNLFVIFFSIKCLTRHDLLIFTCFGHVWHLYYTCTYETGNVTVSV